MKLHPINPAEAIIAPFFDPVLSPEHEWELVSMPGTVNLRMGRGYTTAIYWDRALPGEAAFLWRWRGELDVADYNGLFIQVSIPSFVTIHMIAQVDGARQHIVTARGCNSNEDYGGSFEGSLLREIEIAVHVDADAAGGLNTYYMGVVHDKRLEDWLRFENPSTYSPDWLDYIKDEADWGELRPQFGLYFDEDGLRELRAKLRNEPYRSYAAYLRQQAHAQLHRKPELQIRQFLPMESPHGYSSRSRDRTYSFLTHMEQCAFFGLLDNDPQLIRMAARYALCLAHITHWSESFVEHHFPGSAMNWRSFHQNYVCISLTAVMDWIGGVFKDEVPLQQYRRSLSPSGCTAMEVLSHSLYFKGLAPIQYDFAKYDYIYRNNQAIVFSYGRIAALLTLDQSFPRVGYELEQAERDLRETAAAIIRDDGSFGEGPGYYGAVMYFLLASTLLLAKQKEVDPRTLLPPGVFRGKEYFGMFLSTADKAGRLPISDSPTSLAIDWIAMMANVTQDPGWTTLFERCLRDDVHGVNANASIRSLIYGPDEFPVRQEMVPTFMIHPGIGHATSSRPTTRGFVRLHLCGSSDVEGHSHEDKGAILLEVFGESLLIDRGVTVYNDPLTDELATVRMHNALSIEAGDGKEHSQVNPCPSALCPSGRGDENELSLFIDVTPAWGSNAVQVTRTVTSEQPSLFKIKDQATLPTEGSVIFHLHSYYPVSAGSNSAIFQAERSKLRVTWDWSGEVICAGEELFDANHRPVYHLAIRSERARSHVLTTVLEII